MDSIVRGVEIEDHLFGRRHLLVHEQLDEEPLDRLRILEDLLIAAHRAARRGSRLDSIQRGVAGQRLAEVTLLAPGMALDVCAPHRERERRVEAQRVGIVEVFVATGDPQHALGEELGRGGAR